MKRFGFLFSAILLAMICLSSCKKTYKCECNIYDGNGNLMWSEYSNYKERKRDEASKACKGKSIPPGRVCVIVN